MKEEVFEPKRDQNEEWHKEESIDCTVHSILSRVIKSGRLSWAGCVARIEEGRSTFNILTGNLKGKKLLGRPRRRWEDNITMNLKEIGINTRNWVDSA